MKYFFKILFKLSYVPYVTEEMLPNWIFLTVLISTKLGTPYKYNYITVKCLFRRLNSAVPSSTPMDLTTFFQGCLNNYSTSQQASWRTLSEITLVNAVHMNNYCGLLCWRSTWMIEWLLLLIGDTRWHHLQELLYWTPTIAVTVTFHVNNYCGLLGLCLTWMID